MRNQAESYVFLHIRIGFILNHVVIHTYLFIFKLYQNGFFLKRQKLFEMK